MKEIQIPNMMQIAKISEYGITEVDWKIDDTIRRNRGIILSASIIIERELERILESLLSSDLFDSKKFGEEFWRRTNVTFNIKIHMLKSLRSTHKDIKPTKQSWDDYIDLLFKIQRIRNRFAHGRIIYSEDKVILTFIEGNRIKTKILNDKYFGEIQEILTDGIGKSAVLFWQHKRNKKKRD